MEEYIVRVNDERTVWLNKENQYHRLDGPALEYKDGHKEWYQNGKKHRVDGPACDWHTYKAWWKNGLRHRTDGPAVETAYGEKEWWIEGKEYSEEQFHKKLNPVVELTVDEISKRLGFTVKVVGEK